MYLRCFIQYTEWSGVSPARRQIQPPGQPPGPATAGQTPGPDASDLLVMHFVIHDESRENGIGAGALRQRMRTTSESDSKGSDAKTGAEPSRYYRAIRWPEAGRAKSSYVNRRQEFPNATWDTT